MTEKLLTGTLSLNTTNQLKPRPPTPVVSVTHHSKTVVLILFLYWMNLWCLLRGIWVISWQKPANWPVRPAKTQISLDIRPVWSESSLSTWRNLGSLATHWAHSEDSDQTGRMPRLIWGFARLTLIWLVLSCRGSFHVVFFLVPGTRISFIPW